MKQKRSLDDIKALASSFRTKMGYENIEYLDMRVALETAKQVIPGFDWIAVRNHELAGAGGKYDSSTGLLKIPDRSCKLLSEVFRAPASPLRTSYHTTARPC